MSVIIGRKFNHIKGLGGILFLGIFLLSGCSSQGASIKSRITAKPGAPLSSKDMLWKKRQQQFANMKAWDMSGKVAMRYKTDNESFGVDWTQKNLNSYIINIKNPFTGATVALLTQKNNQVTLKASDGKIYQDSNAERLLKKQAGVELPLEGLIYWMRGITAPQYPKGAVVLDALGRPKQLTQASWLIKYRSYKGNTYLSLPKKIILTRKKDAVYVNMVAKKWKIK